MRSPSHSITGALLRVLQDESKSAPGSCPVKLRLFLRRLPPSAFIFLPEKHDQNHRNQSNRIYFAQAVGLRIWLVRDASSHVFGIEYKNPEFPKLTRSRQRHGTHERVTITPGQGLEHSSALRSGPMAFARSSHVIKGSHGLRALEGTHFFLHVGRKNFDKDLALTRGLRGNCSFAPGYARLIGSPQ